MSHSPSLPRLFVVALCFLFSSIGGAWADEAPAEPEVPVAPEGPPPVAGPEAAGPAPAASLEAIEAAFVATEKEAVKRVRT